MKSGPVFLWRGSVALLCEACQRLMIRWNIQKPAGRRQAQWYVVIPNRALSYADPQTLMHVHVFATQAHTVRTYAPTPPSLQRCWFMTQTWHQGYTQQSDWKKNKSRRDSENEQSGYWFPLCAGRWRKKVSCMREIYPLPWWADCKQLHTLYSKWLVWSMVFHCSSLLLKSMIEDQSKVHIKTFLNISRFISNSF